MRLVWRLKQVWTLIFGVSMAAEWALANLIYRMMFEQAEFDLFLGGSNLSNETQRVHTSFPKEFAPLLGRNVTGGLRVFF